MTENKVALITGASSGIGRHIAIALIEKNYQVVLAARRTEKLSAIIDETQVEASSVLAHQTDVSDPTSVQRLFQSIKDKFGRLDILFNNAGIGLPSTEIDQMSIEDWKSVIDINLTGSFLCAQEAFKLMKSQHPMGGRIINNGSLSAYTPRAQSSAYTTSKHAISGLTKSIALEGRKYNIACGQIDIGNAATDMTQSMSAGVMQANGSLAPEPTMPVQRVTDTFLHMAELPLDANILFLTVMATNMPYVGRG